MFDLSILIPARNEQFLSKTVEDILWNSRGKTEVIVVLDGAPALPPLEPNERVTVSYHSNSIGQRAACNEAANMAKGKYIMKVDAHCAFDVGFDVKMMEVMQDDWTMAPMMKNLHAFDWVCPGGHRRYQGPSGPCKECGGETVQDIVWISKDSPKSTSYCFDSEPHFQYFREFSKRPEGIGDITESMSLQGSCFMMTKERYFALGVCDEAFGSWGSQGIEVSVKTWLSGGKVMVNHKTWYAHLFRTQGADFGFPYPQSGNQISHAKNMVRQLFFDNKWPQQKYPLSWLLERFWPVPGWKEEDLKKLQGWPLKSNRKPTKGVVYYTHNEGDERILEDSRRHLKMGIKEKHIIAVSSLPIDFGRKNIVYPRDRGEKFLDIFMKILIGLEASDAEVIFMAEHDVLYHPSHFAFVPPRKDVFYYNTNVWKMRASDGHCLYVNDCKQLSGLCAYRDLLLEHYRERIRRIRSEGFTRGNGFEPGTRKRINGGYDDYPAESWRSEHPNIDVRHGTNATQNRWRRDQFRNQKYTEGWTEADTVPGWSDVPRYSDR
jgi:glycosyltransferase involved in cell wall biosynthesis